MRGTRNHKELLDQLERVKSAAIQRTLGLKHGFKAGMLTDLVV